MSEGTPTTVEIRAAIVPVDRPLFDAWLAVHDREVAASAWDACAASVVHEDGTPVEVVANNNPYRGEVSAVGDVTPLRTEKCHARYEEPFVLTGPGNGSNRVHFCTKAEGHGNEHYDDVSRTGWRG